MVTKFVGVYFLAKRYLRHGEMYTTLLMSTGLTFGTIASVFGLNTGYHRPDPVLRVTGGRAGQRGDPDIYRAKMVHAGPLRGYRGYQQW